jgi:hypothetical protein
MTDSGVTEVGTTGGRFNRARTRVGLVTGPLVFLACVLWPGLGIPSEAQTLGAILALMIVFRSPRCSVRRSSCCSA